VKGTRRSFVYLQTYCILILTDRITDMNKWKTVVESKKAYIAATRNYSLYDFQKRILHERRIPEGWNLLEVLNLAQEE
jgi:hypothetical protein